MTTSATPRSGQEAADWAIGQVGGRMPDTGLCDHFVGNAFGYSHSGWLTAYTHWVGSPDKMVGDAHPPVGVPVFWAPNHVAISVGGGDVVSSDYPSPLAIGRVSIAAITSKWHLKYLGWAPPYYPRGSGNTVPGMETTTYQTSDAASSVGADKATGKDWKSSLSTGASYLGAKSNWQRIGVGVAGAGLLAGSVYLFLSDAGQAITKEVLA